MMDKRPSVIITTYCENKSSRPQQLAQNNNSTATATDSTESSNSEFSTDFFGQCRPFRARNRILLDLSKIRGPTGSVRGHKDVVRKSLEVIKVACNSRRQSSSRALQQANKLSTFVPNKSQSNSNSNSLSSWTSVQKLDQDFRNEYLEQLYEEEQNRCILYTTTLGVIRRTFEDSKAIRSILRLNLIKFEERDIYLNHEYRYQLKMRCHLISVPALFVDGQYFGSIERVEAANEAGELQRLLSNFKMQTAPRQVCSCCGDAKFIACQSCNGSRKSTIHHFKFNSVALRCIKCDNNDGLVRCPTCRDGSQLAQPTARHAETVQADPSTDGKLVELDENNNSLAQFSDGKEAPAEQMTSKQLDATAAESLDGGQSLKKVC